MTAKRKRKKKRRRRGGGLFLVIVLLVAGIYLWTKVKYRIRGIDISHYQEIIDWDAVADEGIRFAYIKATEGRTMKDDFFQENWKGAREAGILRGAYHFFIPSLDVESQVDNFLNSVKIRAGDLPPALDLEVTTNQSAAQIRKGALKWLQLVEQKTGVRPVLYTMPRFAEDYLNEDFGKYPLWMAKLNWFWLKPPKFWEKWTIWQYSHHGKVKGIKGEVDMNYFNGSAAELKSWAIPR